MELIIDVAAYVLLGLIITIPILSVITLIEIIRFLIKVNKKLNKWENDDYEENKK